LNRGPKKENKMIYDILENFYNIQFGLNYNKGILFIFIFYLNSKNLEIKV